MTGESPDAAQNRESAALRIAVIGDVHLHWSDADVEYFNGAGYDRVLFVGDLAAYRHRAGLAVARAISKLDVPALAIPGNHDATNLPQLAAEVLGQPVLANLLGMAQPKWQDELRQALEPVDVAGYSLHQLPGDVTLIAGRPHSMGGPHLAFSRLLRARFGIDTLERSAAKLRELVDEAGDRIVFLAHNGPAGLGERREDIWGCDFRKEEGDFGDSDLTSAIEHAKQRGKRVLAVLAGHMHHQLARGGQRRWLVRRGGTAYVNAARVPRVFREGSTTLRHHVAVVIRGDDVDVRELLVPDG